MSFSHLNVVSYAPGKIILVGEHAVVYGAKAIAMPIKTGIRVAISKLDEKNGGNGPIIRGIGPFFMGEFSQSSLGSPQILKSALAYLLDTFGKSMLDLAIVVDGSLPPGRGLGSSASLSVALIRGIFRYFDKPLPFDTLREHALALETIFHGQPSGLDHSVVIKGHTIGFQKINGEAQVWPITPMSSLKFVIAISGPHDGTKNAVKELSKRRLRHEYFYDRIFLGLDEIATYMEKALLLGQAASVGELMNIAQGYLNALSLSTPEIENLCFIARKNGALGAKLTGAGGGGAVIALIDGDGIDLMNTFKALGYQSFIAEVCEEQGGING
jgi:hydroxymethylglutaryl-CoA reductase